MELYTLNVGCGDRTFKEYPSGHKCINYDQRKLPKVDVVGDIGSIPFSDEHFSYVFASDIIEHVPITQTKKILTEWKRVLIVGGIMEFRMPNIRAICTKYLNNEYDAKLTSWLLFGGQDYPGNFHYVGFDRYFFGSIIVPLGFKEIDYKDVDNNFEVKYQKL